MKTKKMHIGVGSLTMIMMFVILCLTIFAILSLITVDRDEKLTQKTVQSMVDFYSVDAKAEEKLAQIDEILLATHRTIASQPEKDYLAEVAKHLDGLVDVQWVTEDEKAHLYISYQETLQTKQVLNVVIEILPYDQFTDRRYQVIEWTLRINENWEAEITEQGFEDITLE